MNAAKWVDLFFSLSMGISFILLARNYKRNRSLLELYFSLAVLGVTIPYVFDLFDVYTPYDLFEWGKLISITIYISGLLVLIRTSKPVFARFPQYLTALPFVSFLFFPLILDSTVIKDLINAVYQGGALVVTVLVFTVNLAKQRGRRYYIAGVSLIIASYLIYWLYISQTGETGLIWLPEILFSIGMLITVIRFTKADSYNNY